MKDEAMAPGAHEKAQASGHLWVIGLIAASAAVVVTATWTGIGNVAGYPPLPLGHLRIPTGLTLATGTEGYTGYALWAWLAGATGDRSRKFAGWTAVGALALSLAVQAPYHLMIAEHWAHAPELLVIGASSVPVVDVILGSTLAHLMHADAVDARKAAEARRKAEQAAEAERAEASQVTALQRTLESERTAHQDSVSDLREEFTRHLQAVTDQRDADMIDLRARLDQSVTDHEIAQQEASEAVARANVLDRQLAAARADRKQRAPGRKSSGAGGGTPAREAEDVSTELLALMALREDPTLCQPRQGGRLARKLGVSAATGGRLHRKLASDGSLNESVARSIMAAGDE